MVESRYRVRESSYFLLCNRYNNIIRAWPGFVHGENALDCLCRESRPGRVLTRLPCAGAYLREPLVGLSNFKLHPSIGISLRDMRSDPIDWAIVETIVGARVWEVFLKVIRTTYSRNQNISLILQFFFTLM